MAQPKHITLANQLEEVLDLKERVEAEFAEHLDPLIEKEAQLRKALLEVFIKNKIKHTQADSGLGFVLVKGKVGIKIKKGREADALKWALEEYPSILQPSSAKLTRVALPMVELPDFLERTEGEPHIAVRTNEDEAIMQSKQIWL